MKKLLILLICFVTFYNVKAQNPAYANRMQHIFGNIDKTKVTTGYLKEFGVRFANVEACNGTLSQNNFVSNSEWHSFYSSLYSMRVGTVAMNMTSPSTITSNLKTAQKISNEILIAAQHYNYQEYKTNALTNGDVTVTNDRIYDVAGRNPYAAKTLFAITPLKQHIQGSNFVFKLPSNFIYTNSTLTRNQILIDFGNGQGYQSVTVNERKEINYTSGGTKIIKVKFTYSNGTSVESHSKIRVDYVDASQATLFRFNGAGTDMLWQNNIVPGNAWTGASANGRVTIELAPGRTELTKPLIIIEGFDPDNSFDYFDLINDFGGGPGTLNIVINPTTGLTLNQAIEDEEYDLVFIDFVNSTDFIQRNAYMVEEVIRRVNQLKTSNEKNVVLGMSMGGLVGRYALRDMEIRGETHETKLYISHDSPHQGANVPLAAQALVRHLAGEEVSLPVFFSLFDVTIFDLGDNIDDLNDGLTLLQSPAVQQMLIYQLQGVGDNLSVNSNSLQSSFLNEYKGMGYPTQGGIRNIAISNGSECGNPLDFSAYDPIVTANITIDLPFFLSHVILPAINAYSINPLKVLSSYLSTNTDIKADFNLRALPSLESKQIYRGRVYIKKTILFFITVHEPLIDEETVNSSTSMLALDNANGGIYDIETFAALPEELNQYVLQRRFNFIPTHSSLDVGGGNVVINPTDLTKVYNAFVPPTAPKNIPFNNFFTNPIDSEAHIQFTLNNGNWLISELADAPLVFSCAFVCDTDPTISGPQEICSNALFTAPIGTASYTWSITGSAASITPNGNTATVTRTGQQNGSVTLTVVINGGDCGTITLTKQVWVGVPQFNALQPVGNQNGYNPLEPNISFGTNGEGCNQISLNAVFNSPSIL